MKFAIQLYSLRDAIKSKEDFFDCLTKVKDAGFDGVEFAGYHDVPARELRAKLDELGLVAVGTHQGVENYNEENLEKTIEFSRELGLKYIGVGGAPHATVDECEYAANILKTASEKSGFVTYYHNHTEEFTPLENGKTAMEIFAEKIKVEIDTYWSFVAGVDNYSYITEHADDICLIHLKDGVDRTPCTLKQGNNDLDAVIRAAKDNNIEWVIYENDQPRPDPITDMYESAKVINKFKEEYK